MNIIVVFVQHNVTNIARTLASLPKAAQHLFSLKVKHYTTYNYYLKNMIDKDKNLIKIEIFLVLYQQLNKFTLSLTT